jgi:pyridoxal phosphate enzyme (YggS family)
MDIEANLRELEERIARACGRAGRPPEAVTIVAVTKTVAPAAIKAASDAGLRHFGENRVRDAQSKIAELSAQMPRPTWHMVGHLQSNKAKTAAEIFDIIQSIDSMRLAGILSRSAQDTLSVLLQVNLSGEAGKSGFAPAEVSPALEEIARLPRLKVKGLMTVAPLVSDPEQVRPIFRGLRQLGDGLGLEDLSMGMSDDFEVAIEEGATLLRLGRVIFGSHTAGEG